MGWGRQIGASPLPPSHVVDLADRGSHSSRCTTTRYYTHTRHRTRISVLRIAFLLAHTRERTTLGCLLLL